MRVDVAPEPPSAIEAYAGVPIAFEVASVLEVAARSGGLGGLELTERRLAAPYVKDYDAEAEGGPRAWARRFDLAGWALFGAHAAGRRVGGAAAAFDAPGADLAGGGRDHAILYDLRVAPPARGRGVGAALFRAVEAWAAARGARRLVVETQNVNVPACRFYARQGCELGAIHRFAYPDLPNEVQLLWYKRLAPP